MDGPLASLQPDFDQAQVLLYQPWPVFRDVFRGLLQGIGFRRFTYADSIDDLAKRLAKPDFALAVVHEEGGWDERDETIDIVRRLRRGALGGDPFLPTVMTSAQVTGRVARGAVNGGVDQFWTLPVRLTVVRDGIEALVLRRPRFVVTTDYMGPDRRKSTRGGMEIPRIEVPNALRNRLLGEEAPATVIAYRRLFDRLRVERQVDQVGWLRARLQEGPGKERRDLLLARLLEVAEDMRERIPRTRHRGQHRISQRLLELAATVQDGLRDGDLDELERLHLELVDKVQPVVAAGDLSVEDAEDL